MASLIKKIKGGKPYYYIAVSKRVNGKPRIVHQTYLGSVDRILATFQQKTAPVPDRADAFDLGLSGALWQAAQDSGAHVALDAVWTPPHQGPAVSHYLLLAAFHRICNPGAQTTVADWYEGTILRRLWGFTPDCFSAQAFWDCFDSINVVPVPQLGEPEVPDELLAAQDRLLQAFQDRNLVSQRALAYDTINFHTRIDSGYESNTLTQPRRNRQQGSNLRQLGLCYALDATHGLSLMHHVYPSNVTDGGELPEALERIAGRLDRAGIPRPAVTLIIDEDADVLTNMLALERSGLGWIASLPWDQAPPRFRQRPVDELDAVGAAQPDVRVATETFPMQGRERRCVLRHSEIDAAEQLRDVSGALDEALANLHGLALELARPQSPQSSEESVREQARKVLEHDPIPDLVRYELTARGDAWDLNFQTDLNTLNGLIGERFGRTVLMTNQDDWSAAQVVEAFGRQQHLERLFTSLQEGGLVGWSPDSRWTDSKLKVHAFYCMLGVSLLHYLHRKAQADWAELTPEELCEELRQVKQIDVRFPSDRKGAKPRVVTVMSSQSPEQKALAEALKIDQLIPDPATQNAG